MTDTTTKEAPAPQSGEVKSVKCECCKLTEECTEEYISRVRERYQGRWICGLCIEAVKDEIGRSGRRISTEEALDRHSSFYEEFRSCTPAEELISTVKEVLLRSLDLSGLRTVPELFSWPEYLILVQVTTIELFLKSG